MTDSSSSTSTDPKPFPAKSRVLLHGLKAEEFNGKEGVIQAGGINSEGRQQVFVEALNKSVALKLSNLKYLERPLESLSNKELKSILRHREVVLKFQGMDKTDLQDKVKELTTSPLEIAEWLAHANAPSGANSGNDDSDNKEKAGKASSGVDQLDQMNPTMLRQQAQMMRSMPPAQIRAMNPQFAGMSDAQIQQAAAQMEMMASNPQMMNQAKKQMANMTPAQKAQYQQMMNNSGGGGGAPAQSPQEALANMSPEQLRQQAQAMRSMPKDQLRQMNPQLANMSDGQIDQAVMQMEMMAGNPELMKMANEQMKNMTPEQMQEMMKSGGGAGDNGTINPMMMPGAGGAMGNNNNANAMANMDPSKMLENMDTKQIKNTMKMLKENPEMLEQLAKQTGMPKEGLEKTLGMFDGMSDAQLESSLKTMAKVQNVASKFTSAWKSIDGVMGGNLKIMLIVGGVCLIGVLVLYWLGGDSSASAATESLQTAARKLNEETLVAPSHETGEGTTTGSGSAEDEFGDEF